MRGKKRSLISSECSDGLLRKIGAALPKYLFFSLLIVFLFYFLFIFANIFIRALGLTGAILIPLWLFFLIKYRGKIKKYWNFWLSSLFFTLFLFSVSSLFKPDIEPLGVPLKEIGLGGYFGGVIGKPIILSQALYFILASFFLSPSEVMRSVKGSLNILKRRERPRKVLKKAKDEGTEDKPSPSLLSKSQDVYWEDDVEERARRIEEALSSYGIEAKVVEKTKGPSFTLFALEPGWEIKRGRKVRVKVEKIMSLANDLALALAVPSVRIEAPIPDKPYIGIEVPNKSTAVVSLREIMESDKFKELKNKGRLPIALGKGTGGENVTLDLADMPHLLIAGATGSGKTVCLSSIITSLVMAKNPYELRLIIIDPKRVEMLPFSNLPHLLMPILVDVNASIEALRRAQKEMERRYSEMAKLGARNIEGYNKRAERKLPYIVIIIDELSDLMLMASERVESLITRLSQMARASGIHLITATQRPSVDIITGLIKANFPARISFRVASSVDSRIILDMQGAEKLLGKGDMLFIPPGAPRPKRLRACYVSDEEIERVTNFWREWAVKEGFTDEYGREFMSLDIGSEGRDELLEAAKEIAREHGGRLSVSLLQRKLRIGYPRAARLMELLRNEGVIEE